MRQIARNLTDPLDGFLTGKHYLLMDRDSNFSTVFRSARRSRESPTDDFAKSTGQEDGRPQCPPQSALEALTWNRNARQNSSKRKRYASGSLQFRGQHTYFLTRMGVF